MVCSSLIGGLIAVGADDPGPLQLERWDGCWAGSRLCDVLSGAETRPLGRARRGANSEARGIPMTV